MDQIFLRYNLTSLKSKMIIDKRRQLASYVIHMLFYTWTWKLEILKLDENDYDPEMKWNYFTQSEMNHCACTGNADNVFPATAG